MADAEEDLRARLQRSEAAAEALRAELETKAAQAKTTADQLEKSESNRKVLRELVVSRRRGAARERGPLEGLPTGPLPRTCAPLCRTCSQSHPPTHAVRHA